MLVNNGGIRLIAEIQKSAYYGKTMKESELQDLVAEQTKKTIDEQLMDLVKEQVDPYVQDQLKELLQDSVDKAKEKVKVAEPTAEEKLAAEKAKGFKTFGEYLTSIRRFRMNRSAIDSRLTWVDPAGRYTDPLAKTAGHMEIGDDTQGGFLVPEIFLKDLYEIALEGAVVRPRATILKMTTDSLKIPYINDTSHVTSVYGGIIAYWTAETKQKTPTKPEFGQMELVPHKLAGMTYASNELLADSAIALQPLIKRQFGTAWGFFEDDAFINGTGGGQPLGILQCGCLLSVFRNTANRVMLEDLAEMYQAMLTPSLGRAFWVINPEVLAELIELGTGNAADASGKNMIWISADGGANEPLPMKIFGRPVIVSEKMQGLGVQGDIGFFDFKYYLIGDRQPITIDASSHLRFDYDETAWRFVLRVAGMCWPAATLTTRYGAHSMSPFVVLNAATS